MKSKLIGALVTFGLIGGLCSFVYALTTNKVVIGYNINYEPDQPIPFSHKLHAGEMQINCKYCHAGVDISRHSPVPSLNICMNCHLNILPKNDKQTEVFTAMSDKYNNDEPVEWEKVHLLPDFVKFPHAYHIRSLEEKRNASANAVELADESNGYKAHVCQTCHGQVQEMDVVYQWSSLSMGWCVNCHRKPEHNAPVNCGTCHY